MKSGEGDVVDMNNSMFRILVVDDEVPITILLSKILKREGYAVETAGSGEEALAKLPEFVPNLVITDLKMPGIDGIELMRRIRRERPEIDFILLTAYATVENAVEAMKAGAREYLIKPLKEPEELRAAVARVLERQALADANALWQTQLAQGLPPKEVLFAGMEQVWQEVERVSATGATVLLTGESGTGKSLIAKVIHTLSRKKGPFVEINCAAMPEQLIESELFGHEKGAFTGAVKSKRGKFELAQDGTIFLDEIGEMPLAAQAKLLRVLQERSFERVGGTVTITTSARIVAATNQDLKERISHKQFREDLYYRLQVFPIELPPLRERPGAVAAIAKWMVRDIAAKMGRGVPELDEAAVQRLESYDWPGNIRELHNILERALILSPEENVILPPLGPGGDGRAAQGRGEGEGSARRELKSLKELEREAIEQTLRETKGHRRKAAEILGISLRTLQYKLKQYGLMK